MKVFHITNDIAEASGVGTFVRRVNDELVSLGIDSRIITTVEGMGNLKANVRSSYRQLPTANGQQPTAIFHIHGLWLGIHRAAIRLAGRNGFKVVWSTHGMTAPWSMRHKWWKKVPACLLYQWRDLRKADVVHATTDREAGWNRRWGLRRQCCIPLGTDLPTLKDDQSFVHLAPPPRQRTLLFVGRVYPVKAIDRIIKAFQLAPHVGWRLRIVGPDQAGHMAELKKIAGSDVDFIGPRFGEDLAAEYAACDCVVLASHTENFGATIVDGMAHGKPVIAGTKTPWKIVAEKGCGWWVENDPPVLVKAMTEMMALSDEERASMGRKGRQLVEANYTWPAVGKAMLVEYERLVGEGRKK